MIPNIDKQKIESESIHAVENAFSKGGFTYPESYCDLYETGAAFGYSLRDQEVEELKKENERLKDKVNTLEQMIVEKNKIIMDNNL